VSASQNEQWAGMFREQRERAEARREAAERVSAMLAAGDARAGAELEAAIARGDREQILNLVYRLRQRPEAIPAEPAPAAPPARGGGYQPVRAGGRDWVYDKARREITRAAEARQ